MCVYECMSMYMFELVYDHGVCMLMSVCVYLHVVYWSVCMCILCIGIYSMTCTLTAIYTFMIWLIR